MLGTRTLAPGDTRRYAVSYADFLHPGDTLKSTSVVSLSAVSTAQASYLFKMTP